MRPAATIIFALSMISGNSYMIRSSEHEIYINAYSRTRTEYSRLLWVSRKCLRDDVDQSLTAKKRGILTTKYW